MNNRIGKSGILIILLNLIGLAASIFLSQRLYRDANLVIGSFQEFYETSRGKEEFLSIERALKETEEDRFKISSAFLSADNLIQFVERLEKLARTSGVELDLEEPKIVAVGKGSGLQLNFSAKGSFTELYHLLVLFENLPYRFEFQSVRLGLVAEKTWSGNFGLVLLSYIDKGK